eukprot:366429-Chlamydomonas_euryale.AAC.6
MPQPESPTTTLQIEGFMLRAPMDYAAHCARARVPPSHQQIDAWIRSLHAACRLLHADISQASAPAFAATWHAMAVRHTPHCTLPPALHAPVKARTRGRTPMSAPGRCTAHSPPPPLPTPTCGQPSRCSSGSALLLAIGRDAGERPATSADGGLASSPRSHGRWALPARPFGLWGGFRSECRVTCEEFWAPFLLACAAFWRRPSLWRPHPGSDPPTLSDAPSAMASTRSAERGGEGSGGGGGSSGRDDTSGGGGGGGVAAAVGRLTRLELVRLVKLSQRQRAAGPHGTWAEYVKVGSARAREEGGAGGRGRGTEELAYQLRGEHMCSDAGIGGGDGGALKAMEAASKRVCD